MRTCEKCRALNKRIAVKESKNNIVHFKYHSICIFGRKIKDPLSPIPIPDECCKKVIKWGDFLFHKEKNTSKEK